MNYGLRVKNFVKENRCEFFIFLCILAIGAFLRLYRIGEYMTFLGDEGRDAIIVRRLITKGDLILIGPGTSIGNMYLGPLYYYLIAPFLLLANYSPLGPSVMVALFGMATIFLVWWVGREWFPSTSSGQVAVGGLIAAFLYAISPTVIIYSKSSWNPNIMPFFALLTIYAIWRVWQRREFRWLLIIGVAFAFVLQSHYLGLLLAPVIFIFWFITLYSLRASHNKNIKSLLLNTIYSVLIFAFLMSPLLIFDARHGWNNVRAMKTFFTERQTTVSARPWTGIPKAWPLIEKISTRLLAGRNETLGKWVAISLSAVLLWLAGVKKVFLEKTERSAFILILLWLGFAVVGMSVYKQEIYDHYFGFFFPAPFLLLGGMAQDVVEKHKIRGWWLVLTGLTFLTYYNLVQNPLKNPPNRQLQRTVEVAKSIRDQASGEKFNLAVIAERNYEDAYQYFLEKWSTGVTDIDPLNTKGTIANQLFVVCEMPVEKCDPTHNPKAEVANFGWSKVDAEWQVAGVTLYKLVHTK